MLKLRAEYQNLSYMKKVHCVSEIIPMKLHGPWVGILTYLGQQQKDLIMNNIIFILKYNLIEKWEKPFVLRFFDHYFRCFKKLWSLLDSVL